MKIKQLTTAVALATLASTASAELGRHGVLNNQNVGDFQWHSRVNFTKSFSDMEEDYTFYDSNQAIIGRATHENSSIGSSVGRFSIWAGARIAPEIDFYIEASATEARTDYGSSDNSENDINLKYAFGVFNQLQEDLNAKIIVGVQPTGITNDQWRRSEQDNFLASTDVLGYVKGGLFFEDFDFVGLGAANPSLGFDRKALAATWHGQIGDNQFYRVLIGNDYDNNEIESTDVQTFNTTPFTETSDDENNDGHILSLQYGYKWDITSDQNLIARASYVNVTGSENEQKFTNDNAEATMSKFESDSDGFNLDVSYATPSFEGFLAYTDATVDADASISTDVAGGVSVPFLSTGNIDLGSVSASIDVSGFVVGGTYSLSGNGFADGDVYREGAINPTHTFSLLYGMAETELDGRWSYDDGTVNSGRFTEDKEIDVITFNWTWYLDPKSRTRVGIEYSIWEQETEHKDDGEFIATSAPGGSTGTSAVTLDTDDAGKSDSESDTLTFFVGFQF